MKPYHEDAWLQIWGGDCREVLATLPADSVHCVVTSPPYWGLRDYGNPGQLGLEPTPEQYVENMVAVFREVRRVLRSDGTLWLNLGDSYAGGKIDRADQDINRRNENGPAATREFRKLMGNPAGKQRPVPPGLKPKDLVGIPWRVAFALQADGWYLRSDVIWSKPNPMPESVTDRPTKSHEYLFLLTKSPRYYFDADAVREPALRAGDYPGGQGGHIEYTSGGHNKDGLRANGQKPVAAGRNIRSVWTIATQPYPGAHFAVFPPKLVEPCIKAGSSERGVCPECGAPWKRVVERERTRNGKPLGGPWARPDESRRLGPTGVGHWRDRTDVTTTGWAATCAHAATSLGATSSDLVVPAVCLDPFAGSGTVGKVAQSLSRRAILIDLNPDYLAQQLERNRDLPLGLVG